MGNQGKCIIWGTNASIKDDIRDDHKHIFNSPRAGGKYIVDHETYLAAPSSGLSLSDEEKIRLSGYIAKQNLSNKPSPYLDDIMERGNWLENLPPTPNPIRRAEFLLKGLVSLSSNLGKGISLNLNVNQCKESNTSFLYALSYCSKTEEFQSLIKSLEEDRYIENVGYIGGGLEIAVTGRGWTRAESISIDSNSNKKTDSNKTTSEKSKTAFIAMWIDPSMEDLKQSIEKAVRNTGYDPLRIDDKKHINKIDDEILSEIEKARFVVCDLTSVATDKPRSSVYFEAGYAKGKKFLLSGPAKSKCKRCISIPLIQDNINVCFGMKTIWRIL